MLIETIIYCITCHKENKSYVGQTYSHKLTRGKYYEYGIKGRFGEHIGASKRNKTTPLATAIREHGEDNFEIKELERCSLDLADSREHYYIHQLKTLVPHGYNVQSHSRYRSTLLKINEKVERAEIRGIKCNGSISKIRVLLKVEGKTDFLRFMFSINPDEKLQDTIKRAEEFCLNLVDKTQILHHSSLQDKEELWWPYKEKLDKLSSDKVEQIRLVLFNEKLVRSYIKTDKTLKYKDQIIHTFGGKKVTLDDALKIAKSFANKLQEDHNCKIIIADNLTNQGSQQEDAV